MNERIRELADEAWVYQVRVLNESDGSRTYTEKEKVFDKEKFAELIVRECAGLVEGQPHFDKMLDCATVIEQHFGVEE